MCGECFKPNATYRLGCPTKFEHRNRERLGIRSISVALHSSTDLCASLNADSTVHTDVR